MSYQIQSTFKLSNANNISKIFNCDNHANHISRKLQTFYEQGEFFDIVLVAGVDNVQVHAHRIVLCASSEYFLSMFSSSLEEKTNTEIIKIDIVDGATLKLILTFMYTASIKLCRNVVENVLKAAVFFRMQSLIVACSDFMEQILNPYNCLGFAFRAEKLGCSTLYEKAFAFASTLFEKVCLQSEFFQLNKEQVSKFLSSDDLSVDSEEKVFRSLVSWVAHDPVNRETTIFQLLQLIRFAFLEPKFIIDNSKAVCKSNECNELINSWLTWHSSPESRSQLSTYHSIPRKTLNNLLVVSGYKSDEMQFQTFNRVLNQWSPEEWPIPPRKGAGYCAVVINKKLIIAGGEKIECEMNNVSCLDLETLGWSDLPPMLVARYCPNMCEINGHLYVLGGRCGRFGVCSRSMDRYDFSICKWKTMAPYTSPHAGISSAVLNGLLYVVRNEKTYLDCYDPATNKWTKKSSMFSKIEKIEIAAVKGHLYVVGVEHNRQSISVVERYDPLQNSWTIISAPNFKRDRLKCVAFNNRLITCGGVDGDETSNLVEEFDPETNKWTVLTPMLPHDMYTFVLAI